MESFRTRAEAQPTILVAIEPPTYREVISKAIKILRPDLSVKAVEYGILEDEVSRTNPRLVLCDRTVEESVEGVPNRVVMGGDESDSSATVYLDSRPLEMEIMNLEKLVGIVDRVVVPPSQGGVAPVE